MTTGTEYNAVGRGPLSIISMFRLIVCVAAAYAAVSGIAASTGPVPVKTLFEGHAFNQITLSPDGNHLAVIFPHNREHNAVRLGLAVTDLNTGTSKVLHRDLDVSVIGVNWIEDNRMLTTLIGGMWQLGLFSLNSDGTDLKVIIKPGESSLLTGAGVVTQAGGAPGEVLMARRKISDRLEKKGWMFDGVAPLPGVYRVDTRSGAHKLVVPDPGWTTDWYADPQGKVRVAYGFKREAYDRDGQLLEKGRLPGMRIFWIDDAGLGKEIPGIYVGESERFVPLGFDSSGQHFLFAGRQGADRAAVWALDCETKAISGPIVQSEAVEISSAIISPHDGTVVGIRIPEGLGRIEWLQPEFKKLQPVVEKALPGYRSEFVSWGRDFRRILIRCTSANEPGRYFLYDRGTNRINEVYRSLDWMKTYALGRTEAIDLKSRDGLPLHGYFTRPPAAPADKPLPTVLYIHGGPWFTQDAPEFDSVVQFFATRGYGVLQVNYRGSAGYGRKFEESARRQFGGTMQDDLDDALSWAIQQGMADPARLVVAGASYGGYATLMSLVHSPHRFKAAVTMFPVGNLVEQIKDYRIYDRRGEGLWAENWWKEWVGDPAQDGEMLRQASPITHVAKMDAPIFIVFGERDERIQYHQSSSLVKEFKARKKTYVRYAPQGEGHGLYAEEHRFEVFEALEKFLEKYAPAR